MGNLTSKIEKDLNNIRSMGEWDPRGIEKIIKQCGAMYHTEMKQLIYKGVKPDEYHNVDKELWTAIIDRALSVAARDPSRGAIALSKDENTPEDKYSFSFSCPPMSYVIVCHSNSIRVDNVVSISARYSYIPSNE
ncbi:hypothetical protein GW915_12040 [bacterium]|nr:hypothetical protein [bacterium]